MRREEMTIRNIRKMKMEDRRYQNIHKDIETTKRKEEGRGDG